MHKRAFRALKHTFLNVPHLPPPYFDLKKNQNMLIFFKKKSKFGGGRYETFINVRFRL